MHKKTRDELIDILATYNQEAEYFSQKALRLEKELAEANKKIKEKQEEVDALNYQLSFVQVKAWEDSRKR